MEERGSDSQLLRAGRARKPCVGDGGLTGRPARPVRAAARRICDLRAQCRRQRARLPMRHRKACAGALRHGNRADGPQDKRGLQQALPRIGGVREDSHAARGVRAAGGGLLEVRRAVHHRGDAPVSGGTGTAGGASIALPF
eukprot:scaffold1782_cov123-Isochrysis_galbana.AAC.10